MTGRLKSYLVTMAGSMGGYRFARFLTRYQPRILMFHRFDLQGSAGRLGSEQFEKQLLELKKGFNVVPLSLAVKAIKGEIPRQKNMIVLTIDDGYADFFTYAYPLLKKHNLPATIYVTTGFVDRKIWLWPDRLTYILSRTTCKEYLFSSISGDPVAYPLVNERPYGRLWQDMVNYCLALPDKEKLDFLDAFAVDLDVHVPPVPVDDYAAVTWDELKEMSANGIEVGGHTCTHPALSKVSPEDLLYEIAGCKQRFKEQLGIDVVTFCYPNGQPDDYSPEVMSCVEAAGFESATVAFSDADPYRGVYELRRYSVNSCMFQFHKMIYGTELLKHKLKRMFR